MSKALLSPYQKTFYFDWNLDPARTDYTMIQNQEINGKVDLIKLKNAFHRIVSENFILNSHIEIIKDDYYWVKNENIFDLEITYTDKIEEKTLEFAKKPFDLLNGPIYRFLIIHESENKSRLLMAIHHIAIDGVSTVQFLDDLSNYFNNDNYKNPKCISEQISNINFLSKKFIDEIQSYKEHMIEFWKNKLNLSEPVNMNFLKTKKTINNKLFIKNNFNSIQSMFGISEYRFKLEEDTFNKLNEIKKKYVLTSYLFSKIIFAISIFKYTQQENFSITFPFAIKEGNDFIYGSYTNLNLIPFQIKNEFKVLDVINQAKSFLKSLKFDNVKNNHLPLYELIPYINKDLITTVFSSANFQNFPTHFNGIQEKIIENSNIALIHDVIFEFEASNNEVKFRVNYKSASIDKDLLDNFINSYKLLYKEVINDLLDENKIYEFKTIDKYNILSNEDYENIIHRWNNTDVNYNYENTIHGLLEEQVQKTPNQIALIYYGMKITYSELNEKSNQLAHLLKSRFKINSDDLIALCLDRNFNMMISIFGILKAGAAYVPIDPYCPKERIHFILQDTKAKIIITNEIHTNFIHSSINENHAIHIIEIDSNETQNELILHDKNNHENNTKPNHLSYLIYTSGTTGKPKGVMIEHKNIYNLTQYMKKLINFEKKCEIKNCLFFSNYVFDAHVFEYCTYLFNGFTLHIIDNDTRKDIDLLDQYISNNNIDLTVLSPVVLEKNKFKRLKLLLLGGDKINRSILNNMLENNIQVYNLYGPTEASIMSHAHKCSLNEESNNIGLPISNFKAYVLDKNLKPLPIGSEGELYLGGNYIARGYLNNEELTSGKFIKNPFQNKIEKEQNKNTKFYKTGDTVRWLPNGELEYIARTDFQVKIRGYRIEISEIENTLTLNNKIKQAVVLAKNRIDSQNINSENKYLALYYIPNHENEIKEEEIVSFLQEYLPDYMIPQFIIPIKEFPLNSSGKIDKSKLPNPESNILTNYISPRDEIESQVCEVWSEVLGIEYNKISMNEHFLRLGGDSIISIQIVSKLRQKMGINISVKDIFLYKNIDNLCKYIRLNKNSIYKDHTIYSETGTLSGEVSLLPNQQWFFNNNFPKQGHWNQSFITKIPIIEKTNFIRIVSELRKRHDAFSLRFKKDNGKYIQFYSPEPLHGDIKFLDINSLGLSEGTIEFNEKLNQIFTEWQSHFCLEKGPLSCFGYIYGYKDNTARLFISLHHLIVDTASFKILIDELKCLSENQNLSQKSSSYRQWGNAIKEYANQNKSEKDYWDNILKRYRYFNENFNFFNNFIEKNGITNHEEFNLSIDETKNLLEKCNKIFNTQINDILIASFSSALAKISNQSSQFLVLEGHGREEISKNINITKTLGWFTTMFPVQIDVNNDIQKNIINTKEYLRNIPKNGIGFSFICGYKKELMPKISFNYFGIFKNEENDLQDTSKGVWNIVNENSGCSIHPENQDENYLDIKCEIRSEILFIRINSKLNKNITLQLKNNFKLELIRYIEFILNQRRSFLTRSDINNIISQDYLDNIQKNKEVKNIFLANSLQQGFIFHSLKQGKIDDSYIIQMIWQYQMPVSVIDLKNAWEFTQQKFDALRTRFDWHEEMIQIIDYKQILIWNYDDISNINQISKQEEIINKIQKDDNFKKYELNKGNLFRIYLIKQSENLYTCILSAHHSILDGWSISILLNYLHKVYFNLQNHKNIQIENDEDYSESQKYIQNKNNKDNKFWNNYISNIENKINLKGLLSNESRRNNFNISGYSYITNPKDKSIIYKNDLYKNLKEITKNEGITVNAMIQFAWHKLLNIYGFCEQTIAGMTVSGRNIPINNIDNLVGLYINTLPLIIDHKNNSEKTIIEILKQIQDEINTINEKSNVDLAFIQKNGKRLFDSIVVFENHPITIDPAIKDKIKLFNTIGRIDYPLVLVAQDNQSELNLCLKYAGELFDTICIDNIFAFITNILQQIIKNYSQNISSISYLSSKPSMSKFIQIKQYNNKSILELIENQVESNPNNIALMFNEKKYTYEELNNNSNKLSNYLKKRYNFKSGEKIAIMLDRNEYSIISILSCLKLEAMIIPVETIFSDKKLKFILDNNIVKIIITNKIYEKRIKTFFNQNIVTIDEITTKDQIESESDINNLKYNKTNNNNIVKLVSYNYGINNEITLNNDTIKNRIFNNIKNNNINYSDSFLWKDKLSSIYSFYDIFSCLVKGAKLYITNNIFDLNEISQVLSNSEINICRFSINEFKEALKIIDFYSIPFLNRVILNHNKINDIDYYPKQISNKIFINYYGHSEFDAFKINFILDENNSLNRMFFQICSQEIKYYIFTRDNKEAPIGAIGELCISKNDTNSDYLNNENNIQNAELYRTGELFSENFNGEFEYIGKNNINEIFLKINEEKSQNEILKSEKSKTDFSKIKNKSIIAYYVSKVQLNEVEIINKLKLNLPEYMIPSAFVHLKELPLTSNGKLDRKALPEPKLSFSVCSYEPKNKIQKDLAKCWSDILNIELKNIGAQDDFFELGGNSILAIKLVSKINKYLNSNINLNILYKCRNIENLEIFLNSNTNKIIKIEKIKISQPEDQVLSFAQERLWFIEKYRNGSNIYNIPLIYQIDKSLNIIALKKAIYSIYSRHEILRTIIAQNNSGLPYQIVKNENEYPLNIEYKKFNSKEKFELELIDDCSYIFQLNNEVPFKVFLYEVINKDDQNEIYLGFIIHHIAFDGWSIEILLNEIDILYKSFSNRILEIDKIHKLPLLEIQYKDFSNWQKKYLSKGIFEKQMKYWEDKLEGFQNLIIPVDKIRPLEFDFIGKNVCFEVDEFISDNLNHLAKELQVSLFSLLLSAFYLLMNSYSNKPDIIIGTPVFNRHYQQIENLIGFFVNSLALRFYIDQEMLVHDFIKMVNNGVIEAQQNQDLPFEKLVDKIVTTRNPGQHPIFQIMFGLQNHNPNLTQKEHISNKIKPYKSLYDLFSPAKFDLSLHIDNSEKNLQGAFNYSVSLFHEETIIDFKNEYIKILNKFSSSYKEKNNLKYDLIKNLKSNIENKNNLSNIENIVETTQNILILNHIAPRNEIEKTIAHIWSDLLKIESNKISINDNFFKLGGNSFISIQMVSRLGANFDISIQLKDIFTFYDIEKLSIFIQSKIDNNYFIANDIEKHAKQKLISYQPIIKFNESKEKPNLFMIHPATAGCEVYSNIANSFENHFSCYGVESYNIHHADKINSLNELALYYINEIENVMKNTNNTEYHLFGWSLGGYIALEIAAILESRNIKNIKVYLLDTILRSANELNSKSSKDEINLHKKSTENYLISQKYNQYYIDNIISNIDIEYKILGQEICSKLKYTKVLLFKAMKIEKEFGGVNLEKQSELFVNLKMNNLEKVINSMENLKLSPVLNSSHRNIIQEESFILKEIINFNEL